VAGFLAQAYPLGFLQFDVVVKSQAKCLRLSWFNSLLWWCLNVNKEYKWSEISKQVLLGKGDSCPSLGQGNSKITGIKIGVECD
jgi:hypothetical protein